MKMQAISTAIANANKYIIVRLLFFSGLYHRDKRIPKYLKVEIQCLTAL